jgi:hypothetical protein
VGDELAFIHAGINSEVGQDLMDLSEAIVQIQTKLDSLGDFQRLPIGAHKFISDIGTDIKGGGPLWTRFYSYGSQKEVCEALEDPFKMVIVGHCQTDTCSKGEHMTAILQDPKFSECTNGGCVLLGCTQNGPPALGFVDISLSSAFRNRIYQPFGIPILPPQIIKAEEERRRAEFLKLEHVQELDSSQRYFNKITREKVGGIGNNESLVFWQAPALNKTVSNNKNSTNGGSRKRKNKQIRTKKCRLL